MTITTPNSVRARCQEYASYPTPTEFPHSTKGPIIKDMTDILEGNSNRYVVFGWLFTDDENVMELKQTADLTPQQWNGLKNWYGARNIAPDEDAAIWVPRDEWEVEARMVLARATAHWDATHNTYNGKDGVPLGYFIRLPRDDEPAEPPPQLVEETQVQKRMPQEIELVF